MSGDITGRSFMHGTGDYATGSFELTYHESNSRGAVPFVVDEGWGNNPVMGTRMTATGFDLSLGGTMTPTELGGCDANGNELMAINGELTGRLWRFTTSGLVGCNNDNTNDGRILDGFLTKFDLDAADDRVLFVFYDDTYAFAGQLAWEF